MLNRSHNLCIHDGLEDSSERKRTKSTNGSRGSGKCTFSLPFSSAQIKTSPGKPYRITSTAASLQLAIRSLPNWTRERSRPVPANRREDGLQLRATDTPPLPPPPTHTARRKPHAARAATSTVTATAAATHKRPPIAFRARRKAEFCVGTTLKIPWRGTQHTCTCEHTHTHMHTYARTHTGTGHTHTHTHIHTHTHTGAQALVTHTLPHPGRREDRRKCRRRDQTSAVLPCAVVRRFRRLNGGTSSIAA